MTHRPKPIDTSDVMLSEEIIGLIELLARNVHDAYVLGRQAEGWCYGPQRNDGAKENPCLVPYDELPEPEKEYDRKTAMTALKAIIALGYRIDKGE